MNFQQGGKNQHVAANQPVTAETQLKKNYIGQVAPQLINNNDKYKANEN